LKCHPGKGWGQVSGVESRTAAKTGATPPEPGSVWENFREIWDFRSLKINQINKNNK